MSYSIFQGTMADMTYQQVEEASKQRLPVLFPIAVIEEHGPHMCLGTDTYFLKSRNIYTYTGSFRPKAEKISFCSLVTG